MEDILMSYYKDENCPVCSEKFKEGDDIVVCPECGTPYHRNCYNESGGCIYESKHGEYFYSNQKIESIKESLNKKEEPAEEDDPNKMRCNYCGKLNNKEDKVCEYCGLPLNKSDFKNIIIKQRIKENEKIFGINVKDWIAYLGSGAISYLTKFKFMERNNYSLVEFNFSALWFKEIYFLYRKMYLAGGIFFIIRMLIMSASMMMLLPQDILRSIIDLTPVDFFNSMLGSHIATNLAVNKFLVFVNQNVQFLKCMIFIDFVLSIMMGATATRIYKNISVRKIKSINKNNYLSDEDYKEALMKKGSVNYVVAIIAIIISVFIYLF